MRYVGSPVAPSPTDYVGLINGCPTGAYEYDIGTIVSNDAGTTWTVGASPVITQGVAAWKTIYVKDPSLVWDGSQYACYYSAWNGSNHQVGRATCATLTGTWADYGSNPILGVPNDGSYRENGAIFPYVLYDATASPPWKMWVTGSKGVTPDYTIGFLDSADGLTWTDHGRVLDLGAGGSDDANGLIMGAAILDGSTWYIFYGAVPASGFYHGAYATCTDPATAGSYTKHGVMTGFSSTLTLGGKTWRSNQVRDVRKRGSQWLVAGDAWNASGFTEEACWLVTTSDLTAIPVPTDLMIPLGASWYANSAENPSIMAAP